MDALLILNYFLNVAFDDVQNNYIIFFFGRPDVLYCISAMVHDVEERKRDKYRLSILAYHFKSSNLEKKWFSPFIIFIAYNLTGDKYQLVMR